MQTSERKTVSILDVLRTGKQICLNVINRLPVEDVTRLSYSCKILYRNGWIREHLRVERIKRLAQSQQVDAITTLVDLLDSPRVLYHILSFFSVEQLRNFQLVSKSYKVPLSHPSFIELHLLQSQKKPELLISTSKNNIVTLDGFKGGPAIFKASIPWAMSSNMFSPLNGIFPFVNMSTYSSCFYNLSTQRISPSTNTSLPFQEGTMFPFYGFGFDPKSLLHKLVCIWEISRDLPNCGIIAGEVEYVVEVLTVGENKWRQIDQFPPYRPYRNSVFANGSIYIRIRGDEYYQPPVEEVIVAFDIGSEKFRIITLPNVMVHSFKANSRQTNDLLQLDGHIALLDRQNDHFLNIWISDDCCTKSERTPQWTKESVKLPFAWKEGHYLSLTPVPGTKDIIFKSPPDSKDKRSRGYLDLLIYDREGKRFQDIKISGISPLMQYPFPCSIFVYNESLLPVGAKKLDKPAP